MSQQSIKSRISQRAYSPYCQLIMSLKIKNQENTIYNLLILLNGGSTSHQNVYMKQHLEIQNTSSLYEHTIVQKLQSTEIHLCVPYNKNNVQSINIVIILQHQKYPFDPPYIICTTNIGFPRLDDYRNLLEEIIGNETWWPMTTVNEIINQIPNFINKLQCMDDFIKVGCYILREKYSKFNLSQLGNGLRLTQGKFWEDDGVYLGKYKVRKCIVGISMKSVLVFIENSRQQVILIKVIQVCSIKALTIKQGILTIQTKNKFYLDITVKKMYFNKMLECLQLYLNIKSLSNSMDANKLTQLLCQGVEICNQIEENQLASKYLSKIKEIAMKIAMKQSSKV